jgi:hypothetical protein
MYCHSSAASEGLETHSTALMRENLITNIFGTRYINNLTVEPSVNQRDPSEARRKCHEFAV